MYGISVWARFLFEYLASLRPIRRVAAWKGQQGLPVPAGMQAEDIPRQLPLMEPAIGRCLSLDSVKRRAAGSRR